MTRANHPAFDQYPLGQDNIDYSLLQKLVAAIETIQGLYGPLTLGHRKEFLANRSFALAQCPLHIASGKK